MEALVVFVLLFLFAALVVFPIWAFVRIRSNSQELDDLRARLSDLQDELRRRTPASSAPLVAPAISPAPPTSEVPPVTPAAGADAGPAVPPPAVPAAAPTPGLQPGPVRPLPFDPTPPPLPVAAAVPLASSAASAPAAPTADGAPAAPPLPPPARAAAIAPPPRQALNLEQFMGVKLFAWLGGFALFLGAVFFVKHSIEQGWIPPEVRVALGFLLGASLVAGGVLLSRKRYAVTAQTLCATGIVTLYAVTFACRSVYHFAFFGVVPTFGLMTLITAAAFLLAVRLEAQVVALLGMLGGFLTPLLLSTGQDAPLPLFAYVSLLDLGLAAVALHRRWHYLVPLSALGTGLMMLGWYLKFPYAANTPVLMVVSLGFDAFYLAVFALARRHGRADGLLGLAVAGLVLLSFGFAAYLGTQAPVGLQPARWLAFVFLADLVVLGLVLLDPRTARLHALAGVAVFFLLAAWTFSRLNADLLSWALGAYLAFAALHSAFPLLLQRLHPDAEVGNASQAFAPLALLLVLGPVLNSSHATFAVWPAILLIDLIAIVLAWFSASILAVIAVFLLTLIAAAQALFRLPAGDSGSVLLLVIAGFAVAFFVVGLALVRRFGGADTSHTPQDRLRRQLPVLSSLLPFVLLVMATSRLPLPTPHSILGLALLLTVLALGLARLLQRGALALCALAGVLAVAYTWHNWQASEASAAGALSWYLGYGLLFLVFPFAFRRTFAAERLTWLASALALPAFFPLIYSAVRLGWPGAIPGLVPALLALPALAALAATLRGEPVASPRRLGRLALYGGVALLFITLVFPLQFDRQWLTLAWALEGAALLWLFHRVPHRGLPVAGVLLLAVAFVRLAFNPAVLAYQHGGDARIFNTYLYTYGVTALCLLAGARLLAPPRERVLGLNARAWLSALAGILLFLLLNIEIADYFAEPYDRLTFDFSGNFARDMSYTIGWALYALALLVVGIWKKQRGPRYAAVALLAVALAKLFFHDLASLGTLHKIGALFGVAVIAILTSFLYQRFVPPDDKTPPPPPSA